YTVGPLGPKAMPGELPPASAYTYAVEIGADEAVAAGATSVRLSAPAAFYVENFLSLPVGAHVPLGAFDLGRGEWLAEPDGRVVKVVGVSGGAAELDVDGDGLADDASALAALGVTDEERAVVAELYGVGAELWRAAIAHLTPFDCNMASVPDPQDPCHPLDPSCGGGPNPDDDDDDDDDGPCEEGSIIDCGAQTLGEAFAVTGTPFSLHYTSRRAPGRVSSKTINIPLVGPVAPPWLRRIELRVAVAGRSYTSSYTCGGSPDPCAAGSATQITWDGKDAYRRTVRGAQPAVVQITYWYGAVYQSAADYARSFGVPSSGSALPQSARQDLAAARAWALRLGTPDASGVGLGGFTLSEHHGYDPVGRTLYFGNGGLRNDTSVPPTTRTVAGGGHVPAALAGGRPATEALLADVAGIAVGPDGSTYLAASEGLVLRIDTSGVLSVVAGNPGAPVADEVPAVTSGLQGPSDVAFGPDGSLYIADWSGARVRRVGRDGIIHTVAGVGAGPDYAPLNDGALATAAAVAPRAIAFGSDGSLYLADDSGSAVDRRIRRIGPDGRITTVAGGGTGVAPGPALTVALAGPRDLVVAPDGGLLFIDGEYVRRMAPDGYLTTVAGTGGFAPAGDGGPATHASLATPRALALGADGGLYIAVSRVVDGPTGGLRKVTPGGIISTVAGASTVGTDGRAALTTQLTPTALASARDGRLLVGDASVQFASRRVLEVRSPYPSALLGDIVIPSEDGTEVFVFDLRGRHKETRDARQGFVRYAFEYDAGGRLERVTDQHGLATLLAHDAAGRPTSITGPYGQRTLLATDTQGYLSRIEDPSGASTTLRYATGGLLTELTDVRGGLHRFEYDAFGLLTKDTDPAGGFKSLTRTDVMGGRRVSVTTALGRSRTYEVARDGTDSRTRLTASSAELTTQRGDDRAGRSTEVRPDGTSVASETGPDPRFGLLSRVTTLRTTTTPGGLVRTESHARAVVLSDPADRLSALLSETETVTINGRTQTMTYDAVARTLTRTSPLGRAMVSTFDARGRVVERAGGGLLPTAFTFDLEGRLTQTTRGDRSWLRSYDGYGRVASVTDPILRATSFARDALGRVTEETRPDGAVTAMAYDPGGNLLSLAPPAQPAHALGYTPVDLLASYTPPISDASAYTYDLDRKLTLWSVGATATPVESYAYDAAGRLATTTDASGTVSRTYDPVTGKLASLSGPGNVSIAFGYDGALLTDRVYSGDVSGTVHFQHDDDFRIAQQSVAGDTVTLGYDDDGLLAQAGDLAIARDAASGLQTGTTLGDVTDAYSYNGHGEVVAYSASAGGNPLLDLSYVRDALGRIVEKTESVEGGAPTVEAYEYDLAGRLIRVTRDGGLAAEYTYDPNGNRLAATEYAVPGDSNSAVEAAGTYDQADALLAYGGATYDHDPLGARTHRYGPGAGEVTSYEYDASGSLLSVVHTREVVVPCGGGGAGGEGPGTGGAPGAAGAGGEPSVAGAGGAPGTGGGPVGHGGGPMGFGGGIVGLGGGPESMGGGPGGIVGLGGGPESMGGGPPGVIGLGGGPESMGGSAGVGGGPMGTGGTGSGGAGGTGASPGTGGSPGSTCTTTETTTIEYVIDGEYHRILKKKDGAVVGGYLWERELRIAAELDAAGEVVSRFVYGDPANVPEYMVRADGTYRIVTDHLGSPRLVVEVATGAVVGRMSYDAWGNLLPGSDVGVVPFGFAGGLFDADTELVRFGVRDYDPAVGRWTAKDPIRFDGGDANLYAYVGNDPIEGPDPSGKSAMRFVCKNNLGGNKCYDKWMDYCWNHLTPFDPKQQLRQCHIDAMTFCGCSWERDPPTRCDAIRKSFPPEMWWWFGCTDESCDFGQ
ncbi:MAG: hypothetical protein HY908_22385, partial [Myxococcales bacterium]|nr:hypothetical protein [Myxococcales bacterium]